MLTYLVFLIYKYFPETSFSYTIDLYSEQESILTIINYNGQNNYLYVLFFSVVWRMQDNSSGLLLLLLLFLEFIPVLILL
jgi:hypothetical protein